MSNLLSETDIYCSQFRDDISISWRISGKTQFAVEYRPKIKSTRQCLERNREDWVSDDEDLDIPQEDLRDVPGPEGVTWSAVRLEALNPPRGTVDCSSEDDDTSPDAGTSTHQPGKEGPRQKRKGGEASRPVPLDTSKLLPTNSGTTSSHAEDLPPDATTSSQEPAKERGKKRKRGKESEKRRQQKRHAPPSGSTPAQARRDNVVRGILLRTQYLRANNLSLNTSGRATRTGWHGLPPSQAEIQDLVARFRDRSLNEQLRRFHRVPFDPTSKSATALLDSMGRAFGVRTTTAHFLEKMQVELHKAMVELMEPSLLDDNVRKESESKNPRGDHFQCLMGHHRPYHDTIILVKWHKDNEERVQEFLNKECVRELIAWVNWLLRAFFPEIADRYETCARWHEKEYNVPPLFGLFWNFCINGIFPNQTRIHTVPHADPKNVVGVCVIFVYVIPGSKFNSKARSWFVIWDAGVIIELPPWVAFFYPSSLFIHFNCDISDIEIIHTADGSRPTRASHSKSKKRETAGPEIPEDAHGRGSIVFFSQGNLFSSSETGYPTLGAARRAGIVGTTDTAANFDKYYPSYGTFVPV